MKDRINFTNAIKNIIAKRAGYQCSYPDCNKRLIGPGSGPDQYLEIGECAHIFAASENGPRNRGTLSDEDLKRPENGIYLCRDHHKIIDAKECDYTPEQLIQFKSEHEFQVSSQLGEYFYPITWIKQLTINNSPNIIDGKNIELGKLTLLKGKNASGKSTIIELLCETFSQGILSRWENKDFEAIVKMDNPLIKEFNVSIKNNIIQYTSDNKKLPFIPYDMKVVFLKNRDFNFKNNDDDLINISSYLNVDKNFLKAMITTTGIRNGLNTSNIIIESVRSHPYPIDKLNVTLDNINRSYCTCSSTEKCTIILDLVVSYLIQISKYRPTLFLMDWSDFYSLDDCIKKKYLDILQDSSSHFQSIIATHTLWNIKWNGWQIIDLDTSNYMKRCHNHLSI